MISPKDETVHELKKMVDSLEEMREQVKEKYDALSRRTSYRLQEACMFLNMVLEDLR